MKQETPLQKLIATTTYTDGENYFVGGFQYGHDLTDFIKELLEKEKQAIIESFDKGIEEAGFRINAAMNMGMWEDKNAETYFNNKYNTK